MGNISDLGSAIINHEVDEVRRLLRIPIFPINGSTSYGDRPIIECIESCHGKEDEPKTLEILKLLVQHGADVNVRGHLCSYRGMTAAMIAAAKGLESCLRFLVESGTDLTLRAEYDVDDFEAESEYCENNNGQTALMLAASRSDNAHSLCVKCLVEAGVDLNVLDKFENTALMYASGGGNVESVKFLTDGMSVSTLNQANVGGKTALMLAALRQSTDNVDILKYLVEAGADMNFQCKRGYTALMYASESCNVESVKLLNERMSVSTLNQVNGEGETALMLAASRYSTDNADILKYLVEAGADVNVQCKRGYTALMKVMDSLNVESVKHLTERMSVSTLDKVNDYGQTALMLAASRCTDNADILKYLVEAGADVNIQDEQGYTALMCASMYGAVESVKLLTERMSVSTLDKVNDEGQTALMLAASRYDTDNGDILKYLVEAGADVNIQCKRGYTALMKAASSYKVRESHLQYLITAGADLNVADTETGHTALMIALDRGDYMAMSLLLEKGALVNIVTPDLLSSISFLHSVLKIGKIPELLSHGLDPALSYRDQMILHTLVAHGKKSVVRGLVMNGFPPVDVKCDVLTQKYTEYLPDEDETPVSPLALALVSERHDIARYLIVNSFFTRYDLVQLCRDQKLRQSLQRKPECLEILDFLSARPHSLRDLCLVAISSALSQYLVHDPQDVPPGDSRWMCKPTFRERVNLLELPSVLKRELLHQTPSSSISCESWGNIPLE